jgi:CDP-diacylglycerol pyrophosphatase
MAFCARHLRAHARQRVPIESCLLEREPVQYGAPCARYSANIGTLVFKNTGWNLSSAISDQSQSGTE